MSLLGCVRFTQTEIRGYASRTSKAQRVESTGSRECTSLTPVREKKNNEWNLDIFCMYCGKIVKNVSAKHRYKNPVKLHLPLLNCHSIKRSLSEMSAACHAEWFKWEETGVQETILKGFVLFCF